MNVDAAARRQRALRLVRLLYLVVFSSYGTTSVYQNLYFRRIGLSGTEIGLLIALQPIVMLISGPLWSAVADRLGLRGRLLTLMTGLSIVPMVAMIWAQSLAACMALVALYSLFMGPVQPLMDCLALTTLGGEERHKYGGIRAYGSLGYAPVMWVTGLLIQGQDIRWIFAGYALLMGTGCAISLFVRTEQRALARNIGAGLGRLLCSRAWLLFMLAVFVAMIAQAVAYSYNGLYMDTLGASEATIGFAGALGSLGQTLLMATLLPWLMRRWDGQKLMVLSLLTYATRFAIWALVPVVWVVVLSQTLMGLTYGTALVASVDFADRHAPDGMAATSQALVSGLVSGLGRSLGGLIGGPLYDGIGPQATFGVYAVISGLGAVVFALIGRPRSQARAAR
jgi:MFS family permease